MNINTNNMSIVQNSYMKSNPIFRSSNQAAQGTRDQDQVQFSQEGKMMSRMLRRAENENQKESHMAKLDEAFQAIDIRNINVEDLTDDEVKEVLSTFESVMGDAMHEGFKPGSEMTSDEASQTLKDLKGMATNIKEGKPAYGPPPGKMRPPKPQGNDASQSVENTNDTTSTALELLQELLDEEEDDTSNVASFYQSMASVLSQINNSKIAL